LRFFGAELSTATFTPTSLSLRYFSSSSTLAVVDRVPAGLNVDGAPTTLTTYANPAGGTVVVLPKGTHAVTLSFP
jgi:hypothetical protein